MNQSELLALYERAVQLHQAGRVEEALAGYDQVLAASPDLADVHSNRGVALHGLKRYMEALSSFDRAVSLNPGQADAHNNRGSALKELGRLPEAVASYDRAIAINLAHPGAHANRAAVLVSLGDAAQALVSHDLLVSLNPNDVEARFNRGNLLMNMGRRQEALADYDRLIALEPGHAGAHFNRAGCLAGLNSLAEAAAGFQRAGELMPGFAPAHLNLGNALMGLHRQAEALVAYDRVLALDSAHADAHNNKGNAYRELDRLEEAVASYGRALAIKPDYRAASGMRQHLKMHLCDWSDFDRDVAAILEMVDQGVPATTPLPLIALTDDPVSHRRCSELHLAGLAQASDVRFRPAGDRIRLGYFSRDYHSHPVMQLLAEAIERTDRRRFELTGFSFGPESDDPWRRRMAAAFDRFIDVRFKSDAEVAETARDLGIDIAIDLAGFTLGARPGIFAQRAAPVQVNYLGYPGTMGAPFFDYVIGDPTVTPESSAVFFSEQIVRLPDCYQANRGLEARSDPAPDRREVGLPEGAMVYCCFNSPYKITPAVFESWMNILKQVEGSVLWLLVTQAVPQANLKREAAARGIDPTRILFARNLPFEQHLSRLRLADLFLDTSPYNAHTTASDALRMGLPLVTCPGQSFASRVAASLLRAVGLPELVASGVGAYEAMAVGLGNHPERLADIRRQLAKSLPGCALFDAGRFARNLEGAYAAMHERRLAGLRPAPIAL